MLLKLSCGYEINLDQIGAIQLEPDIRGPGGRLFIGGFLTLDVTTEELEIIRAYHDGKSVDATRQDIKERMDEAKRKAELDERSQRMHEIHLTYCKRCEHGPESCKNAQCFMLFDDVGDLSKHAEPNMYAQKQDFSERPTKPFSVQIDGDIDTLKRFFPDKDSLKEFSDFLNPPDCSGSIHEKADMCCMNCLHNSRPDCPGCNAENRFMNWEPLI